MADELVVRPFRDEDAVATSRLIGHTMLTTNASTYPVDRLRELAEWFSTERVLELNAGRLCLVATRGDALVGTIGVELPAAADGSSTLVTFFVAPSEQGRGVGGRLLSAIEAACPAAGITSLRLEASLAGEGFYVSHGLFPTGERTTGHAGEHVVMTKRLG